MKNYDFLNLEKYDLTTYDGFMNYIKLLDETKNTIKNEPIAGVVFAMMFPAYKEDPEKFFDALYEVAWNKYKKSLEEQKAKEEEQKAKEIAEKQKAAEKATVAHSDSYNKIAPIMQDGVKQLAEAYLKEEFFNGKDINIEDPDTKKAIMALANFAAWTILKKQQF